MAENMLKMNPEKTHILALGTRERLALPGNSINIEVDGNPLVENDAHKETLLGIVIDANLKWHSQVAKLKGKLKSRLAAMTHLRNILPFAQKNEVCHGLFNSVLSYCLPVFGGCDVTELQDLQVLQNRAAQIVTSSPERSHRDTMFDKLGWLTVKQLIPYYTLLAVFRVRKSGEPEYLAKTLCNDNRNKHIILKNPRLTLTKKSFIYRGGTDWNKLPEEVRNIEKIGEFKAAIRAWIKQNISRFS